MRKTGLLIGMMVGVLTITGIVPDMTVNAAAKYDLNAAVAETKKFRPCNLTGVELTIPGNDALRATVTSDTLWTPQQFCDNYKYMDWDGNMETAAQAYIRPVASDTDYQFVYEIYRNLGTAGRDAYIQAIQTTDYSAFYTLQGFVYPTNSVAAYGWYDVEDNGQIYSGNAVLNRGSHGGWNEPVSIEDMCYQAVKYSTGLDGTITYPYLCQCAIAAGYTSKDNDLYDITDKYMRAVYAGKAKLPADAPIFTIANPTNKKAATTSNSTKSAKKSTKKSAKKSK